MPDDKVTYTEAAATAKSLRRLPEESLLRARNILLNLDEEAILSVMDEREWLQLENDMSEARHNFLRWASRLKELRPKREEVGEHGKD